MFSENVKILKSNTSFSQNPSSHFCNDAVIASAPHFVFKSFSKNQIHVRGLKSIVQHFSTNDTDVIQYGAACMLSIF